MSPVTRSNRRVVSKAVDPQITSSTITRRNNKRARVAPLCKVAVKLESVPPKSKKIKAEEIILDETSVQRQNYIKNDRKLKFDSISESHGNFEIISIPQFPDIKIKLAKRGKHPYMCTKCNIGFATKQAYDDHTPIHILRKLKPPVKKFRCDVCAKEFSKVCDVERHTRVHTGEKPCVCNICNKGFQQSHNLSKHLLTHLHIKPFQCDICNKQFGRADVLARHLLTHSLDKPIKCWVCEKGFIRQSQLTHHMKKYHPNDPIVKPEPQDVDDNAEEVE